MISKNLINLIKVICLGVIFLFSLNMIISIFTVDEDKIESEIKSEYSSKYIEDVKSLKNDLLTLTELVKKQKIEYTYNHYINHIEPNEEFNKKFSETAKTSYWFFHYADKGFEGYNVIEMEGVNFNFDRAIKKYREDGIAKQYGGITSIRRITYEEFMSTIPQRRISLK